LKKNLSNCLGIDSGSILVKWPGVREVELVDKKSSILYLNSIFPCSFEFSQNYCLFPLYSSDSSHKDYVFLSRLRLLLNASGWLTVSLCPTDSNVADVNLGMVTPDVMDALYSCCDVMVIPSRQETLCLPLFEFLQTGKKIFCREADYIKDFMQSMPVINRAVVVLPVDFTDEIFLYNLFAEKSYKFDREILMADWNIDETNPPRHG